nr:MAG TPA: hypothetical protein [Caudoviricetes sp.]DAY02185.1 MAG TPA: hypothetical protein [Caudoviricetes sp.]
MINFDSCPWGCSNTPSFFVSYIPPNKWRIK